MSERYHTVSHGLGYAVLDCKEGGRVCRCDAFSHCETIAAALNAAQRDERDELLRDMAVLIRVVLENSYWHSDKYSEGRKLLARFAALKEGNDATHN
jgi:hypothetical protein